MPQAKVLEAEHVAKAAEKIRTETRYPSRDTAMLLLSHRAGLRPQEIAYLEVRDIVDVEGRLDTVLHVTPRAAKYGVAREVPMDAELRSILAEYLRYARLSDGPLFQTQYGSAMTPNAVSKQLGRIYRSCGFIGASGHSGRRTFITRGARLAGTVQCSLRDVQNLAGHADIRTTEAYIELSPRQHDLVAAINGNMPAPSIAELNNQRRAKRRSSGARRDNPAVRDQFRQAI